MDKMLNKAQLALLNAMSNISSEEDFEDLQDLINKFLAERVDQEMDKLWNEGIWNDDFQKSLENAHYRTPYRRL